MFNSSLAGQYSNSLISVDTFREYHRYRANSIVTDLTLDSDIEKWLVTATTLLNSLNWLGNVPERNIFITSKIDIIDTNTLYIETDKSLSNLYNKRFMLESNGSLFVGTIIGLLPENMLVIKSDNKLESLLGTGNETLILNSFVDNAVFYYTQSCCFPREGLYSTNNVPILDFVLPNFIVSAVSEIATLISVTDILATNSSDPLKKAKVDVLEVEYFESIKSDVLSLMPISVKQSLDKYLSSGNLLVRTERTL
jgi:hypothetical protein